MAGRPGPLGKIDSIQEEEKQQFENIEILKFKVLSLGRLGKRYFVFKELEQQIESIDKI